MIAQSWQQMVSFASRYSFVMVAGPQRTGTQLAARIIEHDLGYRFVSYADLHCDLTGLATIRDITALGQPSVWHHPDAIMLTPILAKTANVGIVLCTRSPAACIRSRDRVGYDGLARECAMLGCVDSDAGVIARQTDMATVWARTLQNVCMLAYRRMATHPLFVVREQRAGWEAHQWRA